MTWLNYYTAKTIFNQIQKKQKRRKQEERYNNPSSPISSEKRPGDGLDSLALWREAHDLPWPFLCLSALPLSFQLL